MMLTKKTLYMLHLDVILILEIHVKSISFVANFVF